MLILKLSERNSYRTCLRIHVWRHKNTETQEPNTVCIHVYICSASSMIVIRRLSPNFLLETETSFQLGPHRYRPRADIKQKEWINQFENHYTPTILNTAYLLYVYQTFECTVWWNQCGRIRAYSLCMNINQSNIGTPPWRRED